MSFKKDSSTSEIKKKSVKGAVSYFIRTAFLQTIGLVAMIILSRLFGPEEFGIYGFVVMIIGLLTFVSDIGLAAALIQKPSDPSISDYRTVFTVQLLLGMILVVVALMIVKLNLISGKTGAAGNWVLLAMAISFPLATLKTIPSVVLERKLEFNKLVYPQIAEQLAFNSILIFLAWNSWDATAYAVAILTRSILGVIILNVLQPWPIGLTIDRRSFRNLFKFGVLFQVNDLLARVKDQLFYTVLGFFLPIKEFGYIQWAKNWSMYPYNLTVQNVMAVTFPAFARLQDNKKMLTKGIEISVFWIMTLVLPLLIGMALFITPLLSVFADAYGKWLPAAPSFAFFSLAIIWSAISTPLTNLLNAIGKVSRTLHLMIMWTLLTWTVTPICIWMFGFNGVAISSLMISFSSIFSVVMVKKELPIRLWPVVNKQLFAGSMMAIFSFIGHSIWAANWQWLLLGMISSIAIYVLCLGLTARKQIVDNYLILKSR